MSTALTLTVRDGATPAIQGLVDVIKSPEALIKGGLKLRDAIIENFSTLPPNRNFPEETTGFWERAAKSTTAPVAESPETVLVSVTRAGVRYQYLGGTIAKKDKMLTIPAQPQAYGKTARQFNNLKVKVMGVGADGQLKMALVERESQEISYRKRKGAVAVQRGTITGGLVMYWLVNSVSKDPNPYVLPSDLLMRVSFADGIRSYVSSMVGRAVKIQDIIKVT